MRSAEDGRAVRLKKDREKSVLRRHPWIFSGAVENLSEAADPWMPVTDHAGRTLGWGLVSPKSQIRVRMWTFGKAAADFEELLRDRLRTAGLARGPLLARTDALRYVNSEGDFLPGIILDKYADTLVLQLLTEGTDRKRESIIQAVRDVFDEPGLFEKSVDRKEENLPDRLERVAGEEPPATARIRKEDLTFFVNLREGHKTGMYLDQRENIRILRRFLGERDHPAPRLLDAFCFSGAFGVSLGKHFHEVVFLDSSKAALELAEKNWRANHPGEAQFIRGDAFQFLRRPDLGSFDAVILDPPAFAKKKVDVDRACRGYKDLQRLAMMRLAPGGILAAFSCSHHIDQDLFQKVLFAAAIDAGRPAQILARLGPDTDHPVSLDHPEGHYLKGFLLRVC